MPPPDAAKTTFSRRSASGSSGPARGDGGGEPRAGVGHRGRSKAWMRTPWTTRLTSPAGNGLSAVSPRPWSSAGESWATQHRRQGQRGVRQVGRVRQQPGRRWR